ncbi:MAG: pentapeptide repeat-containing protein [Candidatus Nanopelagicales bacterium]
MEFKNAYLGNANMRYANLSGSRFDNAYLGNADLSHSTINEFNLILLSETDLNARSFFKADFSGASLDGIEVLKGKFYGTKWIGARMNRVSFEDSNFRSADFSRSRWTGLSDMKRTKLSNSNWNKVKLGEPNSPNNANFRGAKNCPWVKCNYVYFKSK